MTLFLSFWFFPATGFAVPRGGILVDGSEVGDPSACLEIKSPTRPFRMGHPCPRGAAMAPLSLVKINS
jgi:hypothetical protein